MPHPVRPSAVLFRELLFLDRMACQKKIFSCTVSLFHLTRTHNWRAAVTEIDTRDYCPNLIQPWCGQAIDSTIVQNRGHLWTYLCDFSIGTYFVDLGREVGAFQRKHPEAFSSIGVIGTCLLLAGQSFRNAYAHCFPSCSYHYEFDVEYPVSEGCESPSQERKGLVKHNGEKFEATWHPTPIEHCLIPVGVPASPPPADIPRTVIWLCTGVVCLTLAIREYNMTFDLEMF